MSKIWTSIDEADIRIAFCCKFGVQNGRFPGDMDVRVWSDRHWSFWRCGAGSLGVLRLEWRGICGACRLYHAAEVLVFTAQKPMIIWALCGRFCVLMSPHYVKDNVRAGGLFWRNDRGAAEVVPSEQTDSEYIIWHNAGTTHVTKNTRECRNVSVFGKMLGVHGCTLTHEVLQHEVADQTRTFICGVVSFSKHVRSLR